MSNFFVKTSDVISVIRGEYMTIHGDHLYIYGPDDELRGVYRVDNVVAAYRTDGRETRAN